MSERKRAAGATTPPVGIDFCGRCGTILVEARGGRWKCGRGCRWSVPGRPVGAEISATRGKCHTPASELGGGEMAGEELIE